MFVYSEVRVEGLETLDYLDNLRDKERCTEQGDAITFESEVSKVFTIAIIDNLMVTFLFCFFVSLKG